MLASPSPYLMESQLVPAPLAKVRLIADARRAGLAGRADSSRDCLGWHAAGVSGGDAGGGRDAAALCAPTTEISRVATSRVGDPDGSARAAGRECVERIGHDLLLEAAGVVPPACVQLERLEDAARKPSCSALG